MIIMIILHVSVYYKNCKKVFVLPHYERGNEWCTIALTDCFVIVRLYNS